MYIQSVQNCGCNTGLQNKCMNKTAFKASIQVNPSYIKTFNKDMGKILVSRLDKALGNYGPSGTRVGLYVQKGVSGEEYNQIVAKIRKNAQQREVREFVNQFDENYVRQHKNKHTVDENIDNFILKIKRQIDNVENR